MLYLNIATFFLVFYTPWFSECSFIPKSLAIYPKLGEDVLLACKLTAPDGYQFSGRVPDLTTSNIDHQFNFDEIHSKFRDSRYHGWSIHDSSSTYLQGFIFISSLNKSDFSINFTCSQYVENDRVISASLILANFVQNTSSTTPAMVTDSIDSTVDNSIKSTTHSNGKVLSTCPVCSPGSSIWEKIIMTISIVIALLVICHSLFKVRIKENILKIYRTLGGKNSKLSAPIKFKNVTKSVNKSLDYSTQIDPPNSSGSTKSDSETPQENVPE